MKFANVCIESLATVLPAEVWTSTQIEERLQPLYERLKLPAGRLELMTGIKERRMWPAGTKPSDGADVVAAKAKAASSRRTPGALQIRNTHMLQILHRPCNTV